MKNYALNNDIKSGLFNNNKLKIYKGSVSGFSIEVEDEEMNSVESYLYDNDSDRDVDIKELTSHIFSNFLKMNL